MFPRKENLEGWWPDREGWQEARGRTFEFIKKAVETNKDLDIQADYRDEITGTSPILYAQFWGMGNPDRRKEYLKVTNIQSYFDLRMALYPTSTALFTESDVTQAIQKGFVPQPLGQLLKAVVSDQMLNGVVIFSASITNEAKTVLMLK